MKPKRPGRDEEEIIPLVVPDFSEPPPVPPPPPPPPPPKPEGPSRRRLLTGSFILSILAVGAVVYLSHLDARHASPGPLAFSHAEAAGLDRADGCADCHGSPGLAMDAACAACHGEIQAQLAAGTGLHGTLDPGSARSCATCHLDHHGRGFQMVGDRGFVKAGFGPLAQYRHQKLDFRLSGAHEGLGCERCHPLAATAELKKGEKRFLGLDQACASCHDDVHKDAFGKDCASCHGQEKAFKLVAGFAHTNLFPLEGAHADAACARCHASGTTYAVDLLRSASGSPLPVRTCLNCHISPHRQDLLQAVSGRLNSHASKSCESCHGSAHGGFQGPRASVRKDLHAALGFPLDPPHAAAGCAACHAGYGTPPPEKEDVEALRRRFRARFPGRAADDCKACHQDPHGGQFDVGAFQGQGCAACHAPLSFVPHTFDRAKHEATRFPLAGAHASTSCEACHARPEGKPDAPRVFRGTSTSCKSCHRDPHGGQFEIGAYRGKDCSACHGSDAFKPSRFGAAEHERTGFPLRGSHAGASCGACHKAPEGRPDAPRVFAGTPRACAACHRDVHEGQFALGPFRGRDCAFCHSEKRFAPSAFPASRHQDTSFPLTGAHDAVACARCHAPPPDKPRAAAVFHGTPGRCQDCHRDVHEGIFDRPPLASPEGCARCHTTERFDRVLQTRFDHDLTGHPLRGPHAGLACASCHAPSSDASGRKLGKAKGTSCLSCHADPHAGQFGTAAKADCARCHRPEAARFRDLAFDHDRDARFKLDAAHVSLACAACHKPFPRGDGASAIRYKPLGVRCVDCHDPRDPSRRR